MPRGSHDEVVKPSSPNNGDAARRLEAPGETVVVKFSPEELAANHNGVEPMSMSNVGRGDQRYKGRAIMAMPNQRKAPDGFFQSFFSFTTYCL